MRMPAPVYDSYDNNIVSLDAKVDCKWEARHQSAASASMHYRI
jgi:hypothetical protein